MDDLGLEIANIILEELYLLHKYFFISRIRRTECGFPQGRRIRRVRAACRESDSAASRRVGAKKSMKMTTFAKSSIECCNFLKSLGFNL